MHRLILCRQAHIHDERCCRPVARAADEEEA
jgi:hypothetical protein